MKDKFAAYHPVINFTFFIGAFVFGMLLMHLAFLVCSLFLSVVYYLTVHGKKGIKFVTGLWSLLVILTVMNPLFNTQGERILFTYMGGRAYTAEALVYGVALAVMVVSILLWFASYNSVMTSDKFLYLFGRFAPSVTLILTMVLRLVPSYKAKVGQMNAARRCIGKGADDGKAQERVKHGITVLSALTSWALEGGVITADSMRSRGYGCGRRTSFSMYRFEQKDRLMLGSMLVLLLLLIVCCLNGAAAADYTPQLRISGAENPYTVTGWLAYAAFLSIPSAVNIWEEWKWRSLKSKI